MNDIKAWISEAGVAEVAYRTKLSPTTVARHAVGATTPSTLTQEVYEREMKKWRRMVKRRKGQA